METGEIPTERLANLRDVGGMATTSGQLIRAGVLYRSDMPRVDDERPDASFTWPPPTVVDLRASMERGDAPHPLSLLGSEIHVKPLIGEGRNTVSESVTAEVRAGGLRMLYPVILDVAAPSLVEILDLAAEAPGPLLVHCAAGKDRTGIVVALLLRLAGVVPEAVVADYMATGPNMPGIVRRLKGQALLPGARTGERRASEVSMDAVGAVLEIIDGHPAGVEGWLLDRGASPDSIRHWRKRIVD
ncbi:tyrosine-protein phosphatase [Parafrankia sp. FMc2]|uniref:tyrosine-protein phosphatase n=1 Tax=Parafrankia sp. FMc2 TaxID=3233196 RepID=UPI0034D6D85B